MAHIDNNIKTIKEAFGIRPGELICLVGAGGKTTLMFAMARELASQEGLVITTTTTKIFHPSPAESPHVLISDNEEDINDFILERGKELSHLTLASEKIEASGKLKGFDPELVSRLSRLGPVCYTIVEADGAAKRALKAPDIRFEPVIPLKTSLVIPIVGIDALGCRLEEEYVFRSKIAAELTGTAPGEVVSLDTITTLMTHHSGITHGSPADARIIPFINKTDIDEGLSKGRELGLRLLEAGDQRSERVVLGSARLIPPVTGIITK